MTTQLSRTVLCLLGFFLCLSGAMAAADEVQLLGSPLRITADTNSSAVAPAVASDADGNFAVAWLGRFQTGGFGSILLRRYDAGGHPLGPEIEAVPHVLVYSPPRLAVSPGGGMAVTWSEPFISVRARRLAADGQPVGEVITVANASCCNVEPDIVFLRSGDFVVAWRLAFLTGFDMFWAEEPILARLYDAGGVPRGAAFQVSATPEGPRANPRVAADPAGGFAVVWQDTERHFDEPALRFRRFSAAGSPLGPARILATSSGYGAVPLFTAAGELSIAWVNPATNSGFDPPGILAQRFARSAEGEDSPLGSKILLADAPYLKVPLDAADDRHGHRLLVWAAAGPGTDSPKEILFRLFDTAWQPLQPPQRVTQFTPPWSSTPFYVSLPWPQVAAGTASFFVAWDGLPAPRDQFSQVSGQVLGSTCPQGLCLADGRFRAEVAWRDPRSGAAGTGTAIPLTGDTGAFWFFTAGNAELLVKVLDGRGNNGHWWVFFGALTDVEFDLTVIDTLTNARQVYHNPPFTMASRADVDAFVDPSSPAPPLAPAASPATTATTATTEIGIPCEGNGTCLGDFQVAVEWIDPTTGQHRQATGVPLSSDSAYFWFFDATNIELIVKVLDGRSSNGHRWVFYGALSDLDYTITVTDGVSGAKKTYHNPRGTMASEADTGAF